MRLLDWAHAGVFFSNVGYPSLTTGPPSNGVCARRQPILGRGLAFVCKAPFVAANLFFPHLRRHVVLSEKRPQTGLPDPANAIRLHQFRPVFLLGGLVPFLLLPRVQESEGLGHRIGFFSPRRLSFSAALGRYKCALPALLTPLDELNRVPLEGRMTRISWTRFHLPSQYRQPGRTFNSGVRKRPALIWIRSGGKSRTAASPSRTADVGPFF